MFKKEYIICSAIYINDGMKHDDQPKNIDTGYVIAGRRHSDCFATLTVLGIDICKVNEITPIKSGFLTNTNRYLSRSDAASVAFYSGQVSSLSDLLISEELY